MGIGRKVQLKWSRQQWKQLKLDDGVRKQEDGTNIHRQTNEMIRMIDKQRNEIKFAKRLICLKCSITLVGTWIFIFSTANGKFFRCTVKCETAMKTEAQFVAVVCVYGWIHAFRWMQLQLIATHWISVQYARGKAISNAFCHRCYALSMHLEYFVCLTASAATISHSVLALAHSPRHFFFFFRNIPAENCFVSPNLKL